MGWSRARRRRYRAVVQGEWWELLDRSGREVEGGFGLCRLCELLGVSGEHHRWECDRCGGHGHVDGPDGLGRAAIRLVEHLRVCRG
jgi:hypothetical protein